MGFHIITDLADYYSKLFNKDSKNKLIICYFSATWCEPCKVIFPVLYDIGTKAHNIIVLKIDVEDCDEVSDQCNITCMPTFKFHTNNNMEPSRTLLGADKNNLLKNIVEMLEELENTATTESEQPQQPQQSQQPHATHPSPPF